MTTTRVLFPAAAALSLLLAACQSDNAITAPATTIANAPADLSLGNNCGTTVLRVKAGAKPGGDGSLLRPYADLTTALAAAEKIQCDVRIALASGTYAAPAQDPKNPNNQQGSFTIDRPLAILGEGQPTINGGVVISAGGAVAITGVTVSKASGTAIALVNPKAALTLLGVGIVAPSGYGLYASGGTVTLGLMAFEDTPALGTDQATGTAVYVTGGAHVEMAAVLFLGNAHAIYASGDGTTVHAVGIVANNNGLHPALPGLIGTGGCEAIGYEHLGAIEFSNGAVGTGSSWTVQHSSMTGVYVHDGASLTVTRMTVNGVAAVTGSGPHTDSCGGFGAYADRNGHITATTFELANTALCGVVVGAASGTSVDLHDGDVAHSPVGACVQEDGYDVERLHDHVSYIDVVVALQATSYSLPSAPPSP